MTAGEFTRSVGNAVLRGIGRIASRLQAESPLAVDVLESDGEYLVVFDAPGATASDVQVRYLEGEVLVRIDRFREYHEGFEMRLPGRALELDGRAALPEDAVVDASRSRARLRENGTLYVFLPKSDALAADEEGSVTVSDADDEADESSDASADEGGRASPAAEIRVDDGSADDAADSDERGASDEE